VISVGKRLVSTLMLRAINSEAQAGRNSNEAAKGRAPSADRALHSDSNFI
jgi:hypothetical protein